MKKLKRIKIGEIPVDSGQIMIVDPCYLDKWVDNEFNYETGLTKGDKKYIYRQDFNSWQDKLSQENGKTPNQLVEEGWECFTHQIDKGDFSYSGICGITSDIGYGNTDNQLAFGTTTFYGDGCYEVYGYFSPGNNRPSKIEIIFG